MRRCLRLTLVSIVLLVLIPTQAAALYLDPGFGSILVQGLIAVIGASVATAGLYWRRTKDLIRRVLRHVRPDIRPPD